MSKESKDVISILTIMVSVILLVMWLTGCDSLFKDISAVNIEYKGVPNA